MSIVREGQFSSMEELSELLKGLLAEAIAKEEVRGKATPSEEQKDNYDDVPADYKESIAEDIEKLALQTFKVLDKDLIEASLKKGSSINMGKNNRKFKYFRESILKRALAFYSAMENLPDMKGFLEAGGCL